MTRETKIGLLVGLAFIIVIGILLSEYNRLETTPAALAGVVGDVRQGAATPHNDSTQDESVAPPAAPPAHPVPTHDELRAPAVIEIGPAPSPARPPVRGARPEPTPPGNDHSATDANAHGGPGQQGNAPTPHTGHAGVDPIPAPPHQNITPPAQPASTQYVAQEGDSVSRMAGRLLGKNTKANRDAIIAANASLKQNPNNVVIGHSYTIPARRPDAAAASTPSAGTPAAPVAAVPTPPTSPATPPAATPPAAPQYWYTVKENDNLWRIAKEQLGNPNAWSAIKELNHDVLKGSEVVHANMRLRLPAKPVTATASTVE